MIARPPNPRPASPPQPARIQLGPARRRFARAARRLLIASCALAAASGSGPVHPTASAAPAAQADARAAALYLPLALRQPAGALPSPTHVPTAAPTATPDATDVATPTERPRPTARPTDPASPGAPPFGQRSFKSGPVQVTADGQVVWVANAHGDDVWRYEVAANRATRVPLGDGSGGRELPLGLSVTEAGDEVWVAAHDSDRVYVLDGETGRIEHVLQLPWGSGPYSVALQPPGADGVQRWALVALHRADAVAAIDVVRRELRVVLPSYRTPHGIAWMADGRSAWITHLLSGGEHPRLSRIELGDGPPRMTTRLRLFATHPQHNDALGAAQSERNVAEGGYLNWRGHPAQLPVEMGLRQLWLPTQYHNMNASSYSPDSTIQATLRKVDLEDHSLLVQDKIVLTAKHVHDPRRSGDAPWLGHGWDTPVAGLVDLGFTRLDGVLHAVVVGENSDNLVLLPADAQPWRSRDDASAPKLPVAGVGRRPMGLAVSPSRSEAYVFNATSGDLSVMALEGASQPTERLRVALSGPVPDDLLGDPVLRRGAELFHTSADPRLSGNAKVSCASCHLNGESDGRHWSFESLPRGSAGQGHGSRRTVDLRGLGLTLRGDGRDAATGFGLIHRSGDRDEVQDFEHTIRGPLMGGSGFLGAAMQPELGPPNAGRDADLDAMAAYLEALPPLARSPHRTKDGGLDAAAIRGATFFLGEGDGPADARCVTCHVPETDFQDFGFHDVGSRRPRSEQELDASHRAHCRWCVNTPSLRGAWYHAPWEGAWGWTGSMVEHLLDFADPARPAPHGRTAGLTTRQIQDLSAFVLSIDGGLDASAVRALADDQAPVLQAVQLTSPTRLELRFDETVDPATAADPTRWSVTDERSGASMNVRDAVYDARSGDHVTLRVEPLAIGGRYRVAPNAPIRDVADRASGQRANALDPSDPRHTHLVTVGEVITITLGASTHEHLRVPVHDAAPVGPGLATWSHDSLWFGRAGDDVIPGFVRFDWQEAFREATGVTDPAAIIDARVMLDPLLGDVQRLEARRVFRPWSDSPSGSDFDSNPRGAPTWRAHSHPDGRWRKPGAGAMGGTGDSAADYDGEFDLSGVVDVTVDMRSLTERLELRGPRMTAAYQLWLTNPAIDYGHALRPLEWPPYAPVVKFHSMEAGLHERGPVLQIAYRPGGG